MQLSAFTPSIWQDLRARRSEDPHQAPAEQLACDTRTEPYTCALVAADESLHLLIGAEPSGASAITDPRAAGLRVRLLRNHRVGSRPLQAYLDISCDTPAFSPAFTLIARDIATAVLCHAQDPFQAVDRVIRTWRAFWGAAAGPPLSVEQQLGVAAELLTLERLLASRGSGVVVAWNGPNGSRYDFESGDCVLEVKASTGFTRRHVINGLHQLEAPSDRPLLLVSFLATRVAAGGVTLPELVERLSGLLDHDPLARDEFFSRVAASGYRPEHRELYAEARFDFQEPRVFRVDDTFPRLIPASLQAPLSPRVHDVRYTIDLEGLSGSDSVPGLFG